VNSIFLGVFFGVVLEVDGYWRISMVTDGLFGDAMMGSDGGCR
jgi:hypothetical protein